MPSAVMHVACWLCFVVTTPCGIKRFHCDLTGEETGVQKVKWLLKITQQAGAELALEPSWYQDRGLHSGLLEQDWTQNCSPISTCFLGRDGVRWDGSPGSLPGGKMAESDLWSRGGPLPSCTDGETETQNGRATWSRARQPAGIRARI